MSSRTRRCLTPSVNCADSTWQKNSAPPRRVTSSGASGWGEIRTRETVARPHAFQACALNHSATHPETLGDVQIKRREDERLPLMFSSRSGQGEIRTHDTVAGMPVFETGAFNHSATCPRASKLSPDAGVCQRTGQQGIRVRQNAGRREPTAVQACGDSGPPL